MSFAGRMLTAVTQVPRAPIRQILIYYAVLGAVGIALISFVPAIAQSVMGVSLGELPRSVFPGDAAAAARPVAGGASVVLALTIAMFGSLVLAVPVSWGYMATRERSGFDQSVVQTIVVLPALVASIMMIVQHSLALAFALAGVAAAVRFRNTLRDVADATYIFLALGIGIAAGAGALAAAAVMSVVFNLVSVLLWSCEYGQCLTTIASAKPVPLVRRGILSVRVTEAEQARAAIERVLEARARKWKLRSIEPDHNGSLMRYAVRVRKSVPPATIVEEVVQRGGPSVGGAVFDALPANA